MTAPCIALPTSPDAPLLLHGDCLDMLALLPDASVHVVVTDPPAAVNFMGRDWDRFDRYKPRTARGREVAARYADDPLIAEAANILLGLSLSSATEGLPAREDAARIAAGLRERYTSPLARLPAWAVGFVAFMTDVWSEVDRVLKPGGFVCAWALPKTADLAGLAMRAVGWTIHDSLLHLFGGGLPKGQNVSKAIDRMNGAERESVGLGAAQCRYLERGEPCQCASRANGDPSQSSGTVHVLATAPATEDAQRWDGWNTQLAPGHEHWQIAQKEPDGVDPERLREITGLDYAWSPKRLDLSEPKVRAAAFKRWPELETWAAQAEAAHGERVAGWAEERSRAGDHLAFLRTGIDRGKATDDMVSAAADLVASIEAAEPRRPEWVQSTGRSLRPDHGDVLRLLLDGVVVAEQPAGKFKRAKIKTYAANVLAHHTGALHVDACRIPRGEADRERVEASVTQGSGLARGVVYGDASDEPSYKMGAGGSWPRNVVITRGGEECPAEALDRQSGYLPSRGNIGPESFGSTDGQHVYGDFARGVTVRGSHDDGGGASRYFTRFDDRVGYFPKASDRSAGLRSDIANQHPTHKSVDLMRWLVRLLAATAETTGDEAAIVLDCFMGSGPTGVACVAERVRFIGIERDQSSFEVARARILAAIGSPEAAAEANEAAPTGAQLALL